MTRQEIYELIEFERLEQDATWKDRAQYKHSAPHVLVLDGQLAKMKTDWYGATNIEAAHQRTRSLSAALFLEFRIENSK